MTDKELLIREWAFHVDAERHVSHTQKGQPFFEFGRDGRIIKCTAPGCYWAIDHPKIKTRATKGKNK